MARGTRITAALVAEVKGYAASYPMLAHEDLAKLCGTSPASVGRILRGEYDGLQQPTLTDNPAVYEDIASRLAGIEQVLESIFEFIVEGAEK